MFEKEIQTAKHRLSLQLLTDKTYVYLQDVLTHPDVHDFYKQFFRSEVEWWIYEQQMLREANPRFHYGDEAFAVVLRSYDEECKRTARFEHGELVSLIDLAVKTRVNYLLRPRTTLKWFVYRGEPTKSLREVLLRCAYFDCYNYLIDEFDKWAANKGLDNAQQDILSVIEFERLIEHIDNEIILEHTTSEFTELLAPLYDFFGELESEQGNGAIPTPALIIFLDDKGILRISQELERLMKEDGLHSVTRDEFLHVIDSVISQVEDETGTQDYVQDTTIPLDFDHTARQQQEVATATEEALGKSDGDSAGDAAGEPRDEVATEESIGVFAEEASVPILEEDGSTSDESSVPSDGSASAGGQTWDELFESIPSVIEIEEEEVDESEEAVVEESDDDIPHADGESSDVTVIQEAEVIAVVDEEKSEEEQEEVDIAVYSMDEPLEIEADGAVDDTAVVEGIEADIEESILADYSTVESSESELVDDSSSEYEIEVVQLVEETPLVVDIPAGEQEEQSTVEEMDDTPAVEIETVAEEIHEGEAIAVEDHMGSIAIDDEPADSISAMEIEDIAEEVFDEQVQVVEEAVEDLGALDDNLHIDEGMDSISAVEIEDVAMEILDEQVQVVEETVEDLGALDDAPRVDEGMDSISAVEIEDIAMEILDEQVQVVEEAVEDLGALDDDPRVDEGMDSVSAMEMEDITGEIIDEQVGTVEEVVEDVELLTDELPTEAPDEPLPAKEEQDAGGEHREELNAVAEEGAVDMAASGDAVRAHASTVDEKEMDDDMVAFFADDDERDGQEQSYAEEDSDTVELEMVGDEQERHRALYPPVQAFIDENLQQRVLKHIFHHNEAHYQTILDQVNATESWRDASVLIDRVFMENEVDPYSSIAKKFSDVVYERFL